VNSQLLIFAAQNMFYFGALLLVNRPMFTNIESSHSELSAMLFTLWLSEVYFQCECAHFQKKNFD